MKYRVAPERTKRHNALPLGGGPVIYWMHRDQRLRDNWALLHAMELAESARSCVCVAFCLVDDFLGANYRSYDFMLRGLEQTAVEFSRLNIPFLLLRGSPDIKIPSLARQIRAAAVVTDFSPLRIKKHWDAALAAELRCPLIEVDAHNVVPARFVSARQEYAARTLRPKIHRLLDEFLTDIPTVKKQSPGSVSAVLSKKSKPIDWQRLRSDVRRRLNKQANTQIQAVDWLKPGTRAGMRVLKSFIENRLADYDTARNDPTLAGQSMLSPYLHFGQVSAQRAALEVLDAPEAVGKPNNTYKNTFLEELIVRRELSDNYCLHNEHYDSFGGLPDWARRTLDEHRRDKRPYLYTPEQFELAKTHDPAWNSTQRQMVLFGKMHGYMRMYWAKKILEWSPDPEQAIKTALTLNDAYELDGRDPNGFVGVLWSVGGLHDRPWKTRHIFGSVRYMAESGLRRKFDLDAYYRRNPVRV